MQRQNSDLLNRYLHAIRFWLPGKQRQDILAELAQDLQSQIDDREAALEHMPDEDEIVEIIRRRGFPMKVAAGYLQEQRLIHPAMLPVYWLVLRVVLLWVLAPLLAIIYIGPLLSSEHPGQVVVFFLSEAWRTGFMVTGIVTVLFFLFDRSHVRFKFFTNWNPRHLPRVPSAQETSSRFNYLGGFIFGIVAAVCWVQMGWQRDSFSVPGGLTIHLAPVWMQVAWAILPITVAGASTDGFSFLFPFQIRARAISRLCVDAATFAMLAVLLRTSGWIEIFIPNKPAEELARISGWANQSIRITLVIIALVTLFDAIKEMRSLLRPGPGISTPILNTFPGK